MPSLLPREPSWAKPRSRRGLLVFAPRCRRLLRALSPGARGPRSLALGSAPRPSPPRPRQRRPRPPGPGLCRGRRSRRRSWRRERDQRCRRGRARLLPSPLNTIGGSGTKMSNRVLCREASHAGSWYTASGSTGRAAPGGGRRAAVGPAGGQAESAPGGPGPAPAPRMHPAEAWPLPSGALLPSPGSAPPRRCPLPAPGSGARGQGSDARSEIRSDRLC